MSKRVFLVARTDEQSFTSCSRWEFANLFFQIAFYKESMTLYIRASFFGKKLAPCVAPMCTPMTNTRLQIIDIWEFRTANRISTSLRILLILTGYWSGNVCVRRSAVDACNVIVCRFFGAYHVESTEWSICSWIMQHDSKMVSRQLLWICRLYYSHIVVGLRLCDLGPEM